MAERNDWKECYEWVREQIDNELTWTSEDLNDMEENGSFESDKEAIRLKGMIFAYKSIRELIDNLDKHGYKGYKDICDRVCKKYGNMG